MFYLSDNENEISIAGNKVTPNYLHTFSEDHSDVPFVFELEAPIKLVFETVHGDAEDGNFIYMQVLPNHYFYFKDGSNSDSTTPLAEPRIFHRKPFLHRHNFYELMFVIEGDVYQNIEHKRHFYPTGSCCLLNRNVYHAEEFNGYTRLLFLEFTSDFISEILSIHSCFPDFSDKSFSELRDFIQEDLTDLSTSDKSYFDFIPLESKEWIELHVHHVFEDILTELLSPTVTSDLKIRTMLLELLCRLFDQTHFQRTPIHLGSSAEQNLFDEITGYLTQHNGRVSRGVLEEHFNYSGDYLYKIVQKHTGLSIFDYGMKFCMKEAAARLATTKINISQIAAELDFTNLTHFYKLFQKEYHMTPKEYRKTVSEK